MSTKLIAVLIIAFVVWAGYRLFVYWEQVQDEEHQARLEAASKTIQPEHLPGMPYTLQEPYAAAKRRGSEGLQAFLDAHGHQLQDPRKAWIQLDYCTALARDNPIEARKVFAEVKKRTPEDSPIYPRIKQLESTFE